MSDYANPKSRPVPQAEAVAQILTDTIGKEVTAKKATFASLAGLNNLGLYVNDDKSIAYVVLVDLHAAANMGAALTWIPKGAAEDMISDGELSPLARDNVAEILNICTRLVHDLNGAHVKFTTFHEKGDPNVEEIKGVIAGMTGRLDLEVNIADYGSGKMSFVAVRG